MPVARCTESANAAAQAIDVRSKGPIVVRIKDVQDRQVLAETARVRRAETSLGLVGRREKREEEEKDEEEFRKLLDRNPSLMLTKVGLAFRN